jgi:hypothetical protein
METDKIIRDYLAKQNEYPSDINGMDVLYPLAKKLFDKLIHNVSEYMLKRDIMESIWFDTENFKIKIAKAITFINEQKDKK